MKVILTMDVPDVGSRGQRVDVSAGFARNYLLPRRLAVPETAGNVRILAEEGRLSNVRDQKARGEARKIAEFLEAHEILATLKIGREGKAFGAVTSKEVAILLHREGLDVDRRRIRLDAPVRRLGVFEIPIAVHPEVETKVRLFVDRDGGSKDGARREQEQWDSEIRVREEQERVEAEARAVRAREAEEATRLAVERAAARKAREAQEAKVRAEAIAAAAAHSAQEENA
jgi:large subunit ribosomal protein L9